MSDHDVIHRAEFKRQQAFVADFMAHSLDDRRDAKDVRLLLLVLVLVALLISLILAVESSCCEHCEEPAASAAWEVA